ncbi:hypothetical protein HRF87_11310 [Bacillus sp. CRN 9]|nr:hypothetical protein [Bacillus sp. CRN 9]
MAETIDMTDVKMIQDRIIKDNKNLFTPFITTNEEYSMLLLHWNWLTGNWDIVHRQQGGGVVLWKTEASSAFFVWNLSPMDKVESIEFALKNRSVFFTIRQGSQIRSTNCFNNRN